MYNHGNFPFRQRLPPPPPPSFQQGGATSQHPIVHQGPPSIPPSVRQPGPPAYGHASSAPPVPVPPGGMMSSGQSYSIPPPNMHQGTPMPSYSASQQSSQWTQSGLHTQPHIPPPVNHSHPRMPPPPLQGQPFYSRSVPPPPRGAVPNFFHGPLPPPPPPSSQFFMSTHGGSFTQSEPESSNSHLPPPPPPPPPPASPPPVPPPLPSASPPPTSPLSSVPTFATASDPDMSSNKSSDFLGAPASDVVARVSEPHHISNDGIKCNSDRGPDYEVGSPLKQGVLFDGNSKQDLPSPPPRPAEEDIARKIEVLCHYIAKNGDQFEAMTRQKEFGNPEFNFLFGGEPGSEVAVAHEYFLWMKKKCSSTHTVQDVSSSRPSVTCSPFQLDGVTDDGVSHSPVDSDMDMEDDITQPDDVLGTGRSVASAGPILKSNELDAKDSVHPSYAEDISGKDAKCRNLIITGSSRMAKQGDNDNDFLKKLSAKDSESVVERTSDSDVERSCASPHENLKQPLAAGGSSMKVTSELRKGASPFRLLQDYASDDSSENIDEPCVEDVSRAEASLSTAAGTESSYGHPTNLGIKDFPEQSKEVGPLPDHVATSSTAIMSNPLKTCTEVEEVERNFDKSIETENTEQLVDILGSQQFLDADTSHKVSQEEDNLGHVGVGATESAMSQKEEITSSSNKLKVDEFGRLPRADASDSDSENLHHKRRLGKRGRSRSRSRSPRDRRRRQSPLRRRGKRSRSPSWSPKKRRSRSPSHRRGGETGIDRSRREKGQLCLDFLRGKCFRGESCRYVHDSDKVEGSRWQRSKQHYQDMSPRLRSSEKLVHQHDEIDRHEMQRYQDVPESKAAAMKDGVVKQEAILVSAGSSDQCRHSEKDEKSLVTDVVEHGITQGLTIQEQKTGDIQKEPAEPGNSLLTDAEEKKLSGDISGKTSSFGHLTDQLSQANLSNQVHQTFDHQSLQTKDSMSVPSAEYMISKELPPDIPAHLSYPQLPIPPISQGPHAPFPPQLSSGYNVMPSAANYPSYSASAENIIPYQTPMPYQHSHFSMPPASAWNILPPLPPPPPRASNGVFSSQFPHNQLLSSSEYSSQSFPRPYATDLPTHSQVGEFYHGRYPPVQESDRPRTFAMDYSMTQQFGGSNVSGEDNTRPPVQASISSNPFAHGNIHPQPFFSKESPTRRMNPLPSDILPPKELRVPSSEGHRYLPPYGLQGPAADNNSVTLGESGNINSRFSSEVRENNLPSQLSDFGQSRITNHYNPYASTFDQPLSTKFSSIIRTQEKDASYSNKYSDMSNLSHLPDDGQGVGTRSSRMTSSPNSARDVAQSLPRSGADQYDPIFDSFEPSSSSFRRNNQIIKGEPTDNSDIMLRYSASNKPQDLVENTKQKEAGIVAPSTSAENDEFGETADGEVGAVENGSPSDPDELADLAAGDVEIDQVKTPGKNKKKSKDSKSMKLFKVALADFVKEVLKPSWRQGNMSKEAFKTIVKKTVDKVSGAMKSHHVPKSQEKIKNYIESSHRKLTKLVSGYVDKYVKA